MPRQYHPRKERELRRRLETVAGIEDFDVAIAAHALVENAVLATDHVRHFQRVPGLQLENWLEDD